MTDDPNDTDLGEYLRECTQIDDLALDGEFIRVPADLAYWSARYAEAHRAHLLAKHEVDTTHARLHLSIKAEADLNKTKMTVADLDAAVKSHPDYLAAVLDVIDADADRLRLRGSLEAVAAKKDMIQSLGAKLRAEMGADPMVRADHSNR